MSSIINTAKTPGLSISLYIKPKTRPFYESLKQLAEIKGESLSNILNRAIRQVYFQEKTKVSITPGAYMAIAEGNLNKLRIIRHENGMSELMLTEPQITPDSYDCPDRPCAAGMFCDNLSQDDLDLKL